MGIHICSAICFLTVTEVILHPQKSYVDARALLGCAHMPVLPHTKKNIMSKMSHRQLWDCPLQHLSQPPSLWLPPHRLPQVWAELLLTAGILWTLPGVLRGCLGARAPEDQLPPRLHPALPHPPSRLRLWGQTRDPRRSRRPLRQSIWLLDVSSSPTTRGTSAVWWTSTSPGPSAPTWMERANGGHQTHRAQVDQIVHVWGLFVRLKHTPVSVYTVNFQRHGAHNGGIKKRPVWKDLLAWMCYNIHCYVFVHV